MTIYKEHTRLSLIEGGNVFKQGDHVTLGFVPRDYAGNILDLTGKQIEGVVYSGRKGIMFQAPATFDSAEQKIVFTIDQVVDYGQFQIEFTATDASDPEYRLKLPSAEQDGRLTIKPSVDNMDFVGVQMTTVTQLRQEQTALQTEYEAKVDPKIAAVEQKVAEVQTGQGTFEQTVDGKIVELESTVQQGIGAFTEDSEVVLARGGEVNLGARLDKTTAQLAETVTKKFGNQKDFVNFISRLADYDSMYYKRENTIGWITVTLIKGLEHISWAFRNNTYDDFIILGDCFYGEITKSLQAYQNKNYDTLSGTWVTAAPNAHYTSQVGASFTTVVTGEKIEFNPYADNRGGRWKFTLNNDPTTEKIVSVYSATAVTNKITLLYENLKYGEHTVKGEFLGDDPAFVPSTGAGTSRGWVWYDNVSQIRTFRTYKTQLTNTREKDLLVGFSNKEFAFKMRKAGLGTHQFVPFHSGVGTAFEQSPERVLVDGKAIDIMTHIIGDFIPCSEFRLAQNVYARNPDSGAENLALISTNVTITKKGLVEILGKMTVLADIEISEGYGIMFPASKPMIDRVQTSIGNQYAATKTDGTRTAMSDEVDATAGFLFTSSTEKDFALAARYNNVEESLRTNQAGKYAKGGTAWLEHRDTTLTKLYQSVYNNATLPAGTVYKWGGTLTTAKVSGINDVV